MAVENQVNLNVINRLKKIEGQIKGIQRMVDNNQTCDDILIQISAVRSALNSVAGIILENHMKDCLETYIRKGEDEILLDELISSIVKYTRKN